jgi:4-carboxymuconolactone decarboxylase
MAPRILPLEHPDEEQRALLDKALPGPNGKPLNVFLTLAHRPELLRRVNALGGYFMVHGAIAPRERELVILRTAAHARSEYEIGQHRRIGAEAGLSAAEIEAVLDPASGHGWPQPDGALLAFVDELVETGTVSDAAWESLAGEYDDLQRVELLTLIGFYRMLAGVLHGLGVELER